LRVSDVKIDVNKRELLCCFNNDLQICLSFLCHWAVQPQILSDSRSYHQFPHVLHLCVTVTDYNHPPLHVLGQQCCVWQKFIATVFT